MKTKCKKTKLRIRRSVVHVDDSVKSNIFSPKIGFPCKGSELNHIKENKEQNAEAEDARRNHFQNKNNSNNETNNDNIDETDNDSTNKTEMFQ